MPQTRYDVRDRAVLITGAARGIGAECARRLAARGARVSLVGLEPDELERVAADCGPQTVWFEADVTDGVALEDAVSGTVRELGGIDVLMTNAGIASGGSVRTIDPRAFEKTVEVNLIGTWRTVRACLPHVIERKGYVLCVASLAAVSQMPGFSPYAASKAGVEAFANSLRIEMVPSGVDVGVAYYSWIDTDMVRAGYDDPAYTALRRGLRGPLGKSYPVSVAADATVDGIERRLARVVAPSWVRALIAARGLLTPLNELRMRSAASELVRLSEEEAERRGAEASMPVGPGGAAAMAADSSEATGVK